MGMEQPSTLYDLVEVVFKGERKGIYRNTRELDLRTGDYVIVQADRGVEFGTVHLVGEMVRLRVRSEGWKEDQSWPNVVRMAELRDIEAWEENSQRDEEALRFGRQAVDALGLPMKLSDAEWRFDGKRLAFYFTAESRVDFRALVHRLARQFRTRVELIQIGARQEAARIGGIGDCGRELCCSTWLQDFKHVSTRAAKIQNFPLNPVRLSGQCGRLKCCLNYELEQYMKMLVKYPEINTPVEDSGRKGVVRQIDIFREIVWVSYGGDGREGVAAGSGPGVAGHRGGEACPSTHQGRALPPPQGLAPGTSPEMSGGRSLSLQASCTRGYIS